MAQRLEAFRNVSEAIRLDSDGEKRIAFLKYLQSMQALCGYMSDQYKVFDSDQTLGLSKLVGDAEETKRILSVIKECAERMNFILSSPDTPECDSAFDTPPFDEVFRSYIVADNVGSVNINTPGIQERSTSNTSERTTSVPSKSFLSENMKNGNAQILKMLQSRIDNAKDERTKVNLRLELHRRLAENRMLSMAKQAQIVREQQRENRLALDKADRVLSGEIYLTDREKEKRRIFDRVLQYDLKQASPIQLKFASDSLNFENAKRMFDSTMLVKDHPITEWMVHIQIKMKFEIEHALRNYSHLANYLPDPIPSIESELYPTRMLQPPTRVTEDLEMDNESIEATLYSLTNCLDKIALNIRNEINDVLEVFSLAYKSLLAEDARTVWYKSIETMLLYPLWPSLVLLFRMKNFPSECRISETMLCHLDSSPQDFGISSESATNSESVYKHVIHQLRLMLTLPSLLDKIAALVYVSQKLCGDGIAVSETDCSKNGKLLGANDLICMLSYVIVQARVPQLVSECCALEQLIDQKFLLGEEGYSLTSFHTALKYLEMKKEIDAESSSSVQDE